MRDGSTSPRGKRVGKIVGTVRQLTRVRGDRGAARGRPSVTGHAQTSKIGCPERDSASLAGMALDAQRVWNRCDELARFSERTDALTRIFLSKEMRQADDLVGTWMREAGMVTRQDEAGNCIGRYEGVTPGMPCLMLGSHLDTVRDAGKYDGMLGVLSAIECVALLDSSQQRLPFAIEVVGFSDEEGVRFGSTLLGSRAVAGTFDKTLLDKLDDAGLSMRAAMQAFGLDPDRITDAARKPADVHAYVELHIEQGPVLEAEGLPAGVVTAINGANRFTAVVLGAAGHAGTVPMGHRRDALAAAAECILAVERIASSYAEVVGTVGEIVAIPGAINVIPGKVTFSLDVRAPTDPLRATAVAAMRDEFAAISGRRNVLVTLSSIYEERTAQCSPALQAQLADALAFQNVPVRRLPSGAGHDGLAIIDIAPIGMLFLRCKGGISHNPAEAVLLEDVAVGLRVLDRFVRQFTPPPRA